MLKKMTPFIVLILFLAWASFRFFTNAPVEKSVPLPAPTGLDWDKIDATSNSAVKEKPASMKVVDENLKENSKESAKLATKGDFGEFDQLEKAWLLKVKSLIGEKDYPVYLEMRAKNEKEKLSAYQNYHDSLRKKYGDHFSYNISEDQSLEEKKINQFYLKKLFTLIGEEKFKIYLEARDKINEEKRKQDQASLQIEF